MKRIIWFLTAIVMVLFTSCYNEKEMDYEIKKGKTLIIKLDAHPSTGYAWEWPASNNTEVVELTYSDFEDECSHSIGGTCKQTLVFTGVKKGTAVVDLVYKPAFSEDVIDSNSFSVRVY